MKLSGIALHSPDAQQGETLRIFIGLQQFEQEALVEKIHTELIDAEHVQTLPIEEMICRDYYDDFAHGMRRTCSAPGHICIASVTDKPDGTSAERSPSRASRAGSIASGA